MDRLKRAESGGNTARVIGMISPRGQMTVAVRDSIVVDPLMTDATCTDSKVGDGHIPHHDRVGIGYVESTPGEVALAVDPGDETNRVVEIGGPAESERRSVSTAGQFTYLLLIDS